MTNPYFSTQNLPLNTLNTILINHTNPCVTCNLSSFRRLDIKLWALKDYVHMFLLRFQQYIANLCHTGSRPVRVLTLINLWGQSATCLCLVQFGFHVNMHLVQDKSSPLSRAQHLFTVRQCMPFSSQGTRSHFVWQSRSTHEITCCKYK